MSTLKRTTVFLSLVVAALATPEAARANDVVVEVEESAIDEMLAAVGSVSGQSGLVTVWLDTIFGKIKLAEDHVDWTLKNIDCQLQSTGITLTGTVDAKYAGFALNGSNASASAVATFDAPKGAVRITIGSVTVPFSIDTFFGTFSHSVTVNPQATFEYPVGVARIHHPEQGGGLGLVSMAPASMTVDVLTGKLVLQGKVTSW